MSRPYTETPQNYNEIKSLLITDLRDITREIISAGKISFYDTCAFRRHANLDENWKERIISFFKDNNSIIVITRIILMELASSSGIINEEYIVYFTLLVNAGVKVVLLNEENLFEVLSECFSTNSEVNKYLLWAVRMGKSPISTITNMLEDNAELSEEILDGKRLNHSDLYFRFFSIARDNKEKGDNLGEELIGICTFILSYLPGMFDGRIWVFTEDKDAASKIHSMYFNTNPNHKGARVLLFSTPKIAQYIYQEGMKLTENDIIELFANHPGYISVLGTMPYDLDANEYKFKSAKEFAQMILEPNRINIIF